MISRLNRFSNACRSFGEEASEKQRSFHLRAGHWQCVINSLELSPGDAKGGTLPFRRANLGSHFFEWLDDSPHWPARQRLVADQLGRELLPGKYAAEHPDSRTGVPAIKLVRRSFKLRALPINRNRITDAFPLYAEPFQTLQGARAVCAGGKIFELGHAVNDGAEHGITVRNRLVSQQTQCAHKALGRTNYNRFFCRHWSLQYSGTCVV